MPIYDFRCKECEGIDTRVLTYEESLHQKCSKCPSEAHMEKIFLKAPKGMSGLKSASKGPLETYKDGDNSCFYTNQLMLNAQETYL